MANKLPPLPVGVAPGSGYWNDWYEKLRTLINSFAAGFPFSSITNLPTTLSGYGITDAQKAIQFKEEGSNLGAAGTAESLNFVGPDVTASRAGNDVTITIAAATPLSHVGSGGTAHANVVASGAAGFMTGTDKAKLDGAEIQTNKDAVSGYAGLNSVSRITKGVDSTDDLIIDTDLKGLVLKDNAGTPHYWRVTISSAGVLTTTDLGTTKP